MNSELNLPSLNRKHAGAYYTPDAIVTALVGWAVRREADRMLDPSCGDGGFLAAHRNSVGIERDDFAAREAVARVPLASVHKGDFFEWADGTLERFDCAAGNPPFVRYQTFKGDTRARALALCKRHGANFNGLSSSWAPFLVATASLLKPGGRMAFVVPSEIGHASYAAPLLDYLLANFARVQVVAVREKLFPELSEDCWLLYTEGFGQQADVIRFTVQDRFEWSTRPPTQGELVPTAEFQTIWNRRLRPFLLSPVLRTLYRVVAGHPDSHRLGNVGQVGIGYVSGDNRFFHLRPSDADRWDIPRDLLQPTVRNSRALPPRQLTARTVQAWQTADAPALLLRLSRGQAVPSSVQRYLDSEAGQAARQSYKCRNREPWYVVPDVQVPDYMLTYMSGRRVSLVRNVAGVTCTNAIHGVRVRDSTLAAHLFPKWCSPFTQLSCELEGHALGGGMLKLEPREAGRVLFPADALADVIDRRLVADGLATMQRWRHYAS